MAQFGSSLPCLHELCRCSDWARPRVTEGIRTRGQHGRRSLERPRLAFGREGDHRQEHTLGKINPSAAHLRWAGRAEGRRCEESVELLDVYPTLIDLCGLTRCDGLEGHSLVPHLQNPTTVRDWPAITSHNQGNHSVRTKRWRYIRYADGSEELYDMFNDSNEWKNLANDPHFNEVLRDHRQWLPKVDMAAVLSSRGRLLTYNKAGDEVIWEGELIRRDSPIP
jgi:hypothetical protein